MSKSPAFQFYPADWQRDLSEHPLEIEGAWIRICCALWWSDTPGRSSKPLTNWARVLRVGERKCKTIIDYLVNQNIAEVVIQNQSITISSRRMVKDEYIRNIRRNAGQMGGNPSLKKEEKDGDLDKQNLVNQKPTPSSSSSNNKEKKDIPARKKYLDSVMLTDTEYEKLREVMGQKNLESGIEQLDYSITVKGGKYKDHYKTLLNWLKRGFIAGGNGNGQQIKKPTHLPSPEEELEEFNRTWRAQL